MHDPMQARFRQTYSLERKSTCLHENVLARESAYRSMRLQEDVACRGQVHQVLEGDMSTREPVHGQVAS